MKQKRKIPRVLIIDNYDSFTYNIVYLLRNLGIKVKVISNDTHKTPKELLAYEFSHLIISPGPNAPKNARFSLKAIRFFKKSKRILGVCLGHQCIAYAFGGKISKLPSPQHGKLTRIYHNDDVLFGSITQGFQACLYHSLYVSKIPKSCKILAHSQENIIMALKHKKYKIYGVQFHPEAVLSQSGIEIFTNFIES